MNTSGRFLTCASRPLQPASHPKPASRRYEADPGSNPPLRRFRTSTSQNRMMTPRSSRRPSGVAILRKKQSDNRIHKCIPRYDEAGLPVYRDRRGRRRRHACYPHPDDRTNGAGRVDVSSRGSGRFRPYQGSAGPTGGFALALATDFHFQAAA